MTAALNWRCWRHDRMDLPDVIAHCLSLPGAEETTPFGPEALVYKVSGKMFAVTVPEDFPARINLKCDPERAIELRDEHKAIKPGWHMNKKHWNTVILDGSLPPKLIRELVEHSYQLVVDALPKKAREALRK
jgi:predicted DNA-binding protein (MmcQ/YjbR family)